MNIRSVTRDEEIPADRLAEAGVWIARLHGGERDGALELGFKHWLKAHPLNGPAFEFATEVWEDSQGLRKIVPFAHEIRQPSQGRSRRPLLALTAAIMTLVFVGAVLYFNREQGIATGVGEQRSMVLEDGTRVFLNTQTRLISAYDKHSRRVELTSGEAWFEVAKRPDWPFVVSAGNRRVTALGTSFVVRYDARRTSVTLVEGKVAVSVAEDARAQPSVTATGQNSSSTVATRPEVVTLTAGQRLTVATGGTPKVDTPPMDKATAWRRGQVVLDDMTLGDAITEMNRYSNVKLSVRQTQAAQVVVNGLFQAGDSLSFARAIAQAYGLRAVEHGDEIVLEGAPRSFAHPSSAVR